ERNVITMRDVETDSRVAEWARPIYRTFGIRSGVFAPMLHTGSVVGLLSVFYKEADAVTTAHVALLQTFADQAVIAIENVRLVNETKEALDRQTATSDILKVIASSPTDVQPVFDTIVRNAGRVCDATDAALLLADAAEVVVAAHWGPVGGSAGLRFPLTRGSV